ncbi:NINE protein [Micrococcus luteus]
MTRPEADTFLALEWVNVTVAPPKVSDRVLPTVAGLFVRWGSMRPHGAGWYRADGNARYWDGLRWTLDTLTLEAAKALVVREWEEAGDRAAAQGVPPKSRKVAGLLAIFLGSLGIHRMYLGDVLLGVVLALVCVISIGFLFGVPTLVLGVVEGILLLRNAPAYKRDARGMLLAA